MLGKKWKMLVNSVGTVGLMRPQGFVALQDLLQCPLGVFKDMAFYFPVGDPIVCDQ